MSALQEGVTDPGTCIDAALRWRRYNTRHDAVLSELSKTITKNLPRGTSTITDLGSEYCFPTQLASTDPRPDMVWWNVTTMTATLLELTIPFDTLLNEAAERKRDKYLELESSIKESGYKVTLLTVEVGSRGLPNTTGFKRLQKELGLSRKATKTLMVETSKLATIGSHKIWCARNQPPV